MTKKFCMVCGYFEPKSWCFGYCRAKDQYIHTSLKNCSVGFNSEYALSNGQERILQHWDKAIEWAEKRYSSLDEFYDSLNGKEIDKK